MNLFRLLGDLSHLLSILILIHKISSSRSCRGISFKSQFILFIVFVTRLPFSSIYYYQQITNINKQHQQTDTLI
jgi:hypothetical protein